MLIHKKLQKRSGLKNKTLPIKGPITQFDVNGLPIKHFSSIQDAVKKSAKSNLVKALRGRIHSHGGFFWRYGIHHQPLKMEEVRRDQRECIHATLGQQLGIKNISSDPIPPILNLSLENIKGERWRDIESYEGLYQVSSYGRIKSLRRKMESKLERWKPERMMRLTATTDQSKKSKLIITAQLIKKGKKKNILLVRLVYHAFIKRINMSDPLIRFSYKDGNRLNFNYKNIKQNKILE